MSEASHSFSENVYIKPRKHLGQHFLQDQDVVRRIVDALALSKEDVVVELGAGKGVLTRQLVPKAKTVVGVELDDRLCDVLRRHFAGQAGFQLLQQDILTISLEKICADAGRERVKVVGNLPYNITSPILFKLIDERRFVHSTVIMMQKEVAERLVAAPGGKTYGVPSIITQIYGKPQILFTVPPRAFKPAPQVQSAVLRLDWHEQPPIHLTDERLYFRVVKAVFAQRRKMLRNSLLQAPHVTRENLAQIAEMAGIDLTRRPETLSIAEFAGLTAAIIHLAR